MEASTQIASIRIPVSLDLSAFNRDLSGLQSIAIPKLHLRPTVDHTELKALNAHFDLKVKHHKDVQRYFNSAPLKPKVDYSELVKLQTELKKFKDVSFSISLDSKVNVQAANDIADKTAKSVGAAVSKAMNGSLFTNIGSGLASSLGSALSTTFNAVIGNTLGAVVRGSFERIGSELSGGLGKGLSKAFEQATASSIGSSELLGKNIVQGLTSKLESGLTANVKSKLTKAKAEIAREAKDILKDIIPEQELNLEGLTIRAKQRAKAESKKPIIREQVTYERRSALRSVSDVTSGLNETVQYLDQNKNAQFRGENLKLKLESEKSVAEFERNQKRVEELTKAIEETTGHLSDLSTQEIKLLEQQSKLNDRFRKLKAEIKSTSANVERFQPKADPKFYQQAIERATGGKLPTEDLIPKLIVADAKLKKAGAVAQYGIESNTIQVTKELHTAIENGQLTAAQMYTLMEELHHAVDFGFGQSKGVNASKQGRMLRPMVNFTPEEYAEVAPELQHYAPKERESELNAKVRAKRDAKALFEEQQKTKTIDVLEGSFGLGGQKYLATLESKVAGLKKNAANIEEMAAFMKMGVGAGVDKFVDAIKEIESASNVISHKLANARHLKAGDIFMLQGQIGQQFKEIELLTAQFPLVKQQFVDHVDATKKLRKQAERQEQIQAVAQGVGSAARSVVNIGQSIVNSKPVQALGATASGVGKAIGTSARVGYSVLQGAENLALDMIPMGRSIKGVGQQVVLPAALFSAATHMLPGGAAVGEGLTSLANGAMSPLAHGASSSLASNAANFVSHAVPNLFGMQAHITTALTSSINTLVSGAAGVIAEVGTAVLGGKVIQNAISKPAQLAFPNVGLVGRKEQLSLPFAPQSKDLALVEASGQPKESQAKLSEAAKNIAYQTGKVTKVAVDNITEISAQIQKISPEQALERANVISERFRSAFANLKKAQKEGNVALANTLAKSIKDMADAATQELSYFTKTLGADAKMGTKIGNQLNQTKAQVTQAYNKTKRYSTIQENTIDVESEESKQQLNLPRVPGAQGINASLTDAENAADKFDAAFKRIDASSQKALNSSHNAIVEVSEAITEGKTLAETVESPFQKLFKSADSLVTVFAGFAALGFVTGVLKSISDATVKTALEFEALQRSIDFVAGGTDKGFDKITALKAESNRLGTNFREAAVGYVQFSAATRDTPIEGVATDQIFSSLNVASSAFNLDKEKQKRINTAVSQMAGKGVVSMEELRGQLGESLPGAINIAARSLGLTTQELNRLVKTGALMTEDFLPKFAQQMKAELVVPAEEGSKSAQASFNRLNNAVTELQVSVGKGFLPASSLGAELAAKGLGFMTANAKTAMVVMSALSVVLANELRVAFTSLVPQIIKFGQSIGLIPASFAGLSGGIKGLVPVFAEFALKLGLVAAAFKLIGDGVDFMKDKSGELRTIADTNKKSLDALTPKKKDEIKEDNILLKIPVVSQIAQLAGQESALTKYLNSRKELRDSQKALNEFEDTTRKNITFTQAEANSPEVKRGQELARLLNTNRSTQRNIKAVNPSNTQDLQKLKLEEADLLKQQEAVTLKTGKTQAAIAQNIANLKSVISTLENKPEFAGQLQTFKGLLSQAEQEQDALNKKINVGALEVEKFNKNWSRVIDTLADVRASIELNSAKTTASIGNQELSGNLTQGQADSQIKQVQQSQQQQILQAQKATRDQLRSNLSGSDVRATFQQLGINDNTGQAQLKTIEGKITGEREKSLVAKFGEYKQLEADITQAETQIVQTKVESARQLTETAKSVNDFFRQIQNQTKDLIFTIKSLDLDTKLNNEKARIKGAMSGFYTSFVDEFVDSIIGVIELTNEKTKNLNDAANQIQQRIRGLEETQLQASEMSNGLPGGNFSGDISGAVSGQVQPYKTIATGTLAAQEYGAPRPGRTHAGQDLDLGDNDSFQSYIGGKVTQIGDDPGGYFKWIDVYNARLKRVERIAELDNVNAKVGDNIAPGQVVGKGTTSTGVVHYEIRTDADRQGRGGFGASGTEDPVAFLQKLGLVKRQGSSLIPTGKVNQGASIADDHATPTASMGSLSVGGFDGQKIAQAVAFYISQGISKQGATYLVGSAIQESGLKPSADNGSHRGLYQWDNNRSQGMPSDFIGQLKFSLKDLAKDSPDSLATLKNPNASASDHAKAIQNWERYGTNEAGSRYQYAEQIYSKIKDQGSAPMLPTTGQTQGSIENNEKVNALAGLWQSQLDDSTKQAMVNVQQESAALTANAQSKNKLIDAQIKDQQKKEAKKFQASIADQEKTVIGYERTLADIRADFGDSTPFKELEKELLNLRRQKDDNTKQLKVDYEKVVENITKAKAAIKLFDVKGATPQQKASVALLKEALPELERQEKHLKAVKDQYDKTYSAAELDKVNKFNQALYEERVQVAQEIAQATQELARARTEAFTGQARGSLQSSQAGLVMGLSALPSTVAAEQAALNQKFAELDKQQRSGSKTSDEVRILKENLSAISNLNLSNTIEQLRKIGEEIKVQSEATKFSNYQAIYESKSKLASANTQTYRLYGLETQASDSDKQQAVAQIDFDYVNQVRALEQMVRTTPEAAGAAKELKTNLDEIRNLNLDNVAKQFDPVTKIIGNAKEAFQGLLTDVFSGTKGFVQSISDFFLNIGNQLLGYATQYFTDKIFGQVLGKNNKVKPEGATADSFGGLDFYRDQLNIEDTFKATVTSASEQWLEYNKQASQLILDAAGAFNQMAVGMAGSNLMGTDGAFDFLSSGFTGVTEPNQNISAIGVWDSAPNNLFDAAASASYTIQEGVNIASETLANSGTGASDNLLGNLSKGLPGIFQGLAGVIGGQPGAGGNLFGSILGMLPKIFGFSTGGIIGSGRDHRDDQLILAQRGEAILSHQAVDLIGTGAIHQLNQGKMPKFAKGGMPVPQGLLNDGRYASASFNQGTQQSPVTERGEVVTNVTVNVTINSDGSSSTTGNTGDALGTKFVNAVKGVILQEKKPGGLIPS